MEAGWFNSDALGLLGTQELAANELTSNPQLQWRPQRLLDSSPSRWDGGFFLQCLQERLQGTEGGDVDLLLAGAPSGTTHPSDFCAEILTEIAADLEPTGHRLRRSRALQTDDHHA